MNLDDAQDIYDAHTGKASDVARQLSLAGVAIVWIFSGGNTSTGVVVKIKSDLLRVGVLLVVGLGADLLQYVSASAAWGVFRRVKELQATQNAAQGLFAPTTFLAPRWINWPSIAFFWVKLASIMAAYVLLGIALEHRLL